MRHAPAMGYSWPQDPYVDRNDRQSRNLSMATALSYSRSSRNLPRETTPDELVHG